MGGGAANLWDVSLVCYGGMALTTAQAKGAMEYLEGRSVAEVCGETW